MTSREFRYHRNKNIRDYFDWSIPTKIPVNQRICENEGCSHYATVKCELDYQNEETKECTEQVEDKCSEC